MKKEKTDQPKKRHRLIKFFIFLIVLIVLVSISTQCSNSKSKNVEYTWPDSELGSILPLPESKYGKVTFESDDFLTIKVYKTSVKQFETYVKSCADKGICIDPSRTNQSYNAENEDGYSLLLTYNEEEKTMSINLSAPAWGTLGVFKWPNSKVAKLLPIPNSNIGNISWENADGFEIYVGETSKAQYDSYVSQCEKNAFTINYQKSEDFYYADNKNGYHLQLKFEGHDIMFIRIDAPNEKEHDNSNTEESWENADETLGESTSTLNISSEANDESDNGINSEFKEVMDSYEAFIDEYISFMKKYQKSNNELSMLSDYLNYMTKYTEVMEKLNTMEDDNLSDAELVYYQKVMARISEKLLEIAIAK